MRGFGALSPHRAEDLPHEGGNYLSVYIHKPRYVGNAAPEGADPRGDHLLWSAQHPASHAVSKYSLAVCFVRVIIRNIFLDRQNVNRQNLRHRRAKCVRCNPRAAATCSGPFCMYERARKMAFSPRNLSVLAYANSFTLWHYKGGEDSLTDIVGEDYFEDGGELLGQGDVLMITANDGARLVWVAETGEDPVRLTSMA